MKIEIGPYVEEGKRKIDIQIDRYDTWNMDHTLSLIILPMLKQMKKERHGSCMVDDEDVSENLRVSNHEVWEDQMCFKFYHKDQNLIDDYVHKRWDWIMNEMIWTFKQIKNNCKKDEMFFGKNGKMVDKKGFEAYHDRILNGTRLFGKYFRGLWD